MILLSFFTIKNNIRENKIDKELIGSRIRSEKGNQSVRNN